MLVPGEKVYQTITEAKSVLLPPEYRIEPTEFFCSDAKKVFKSPSHIVPLKTIIKVTTPKGPQIVSAIDFGGSMICFTGNKFVTENKFIYNFLMKQKGVACLGTVRVVSKLEPIIQRMKPEPVKEVPKTEERQPAFRRPKLFGA